MRKFIVLFIAFKLIFLSSLRADEGMWLLTLIGKNYEQMKAQGFRLTPEDLYSVNKASLKDAVIALDRGSCTGELVSPYGLILTNHHCAYGEIQEHSTVEHDYLTNGFWAKTRKDELPNPGKTASFLIRIEDVTDKVMAELKDDMSETERDAILRKISKKLEKEAVGDTHYEARVQSFFHDNAYYLMVYEVFKDVRLVGAPPESIGKYGHDTDNWMWPRHTGDFAVLRVYCGPDGKPAEYSEDNIPYKPKHFFPINIEGVKTNDFTMIMGYPGSTDRYLTSWGVEETMNHTNTIREKVREEKLRILKESMDKDKKIRIQYASKYAQSANYWKYSIGQNKGLKDLKVVDRKQDIEKELGKWIKKEKDRKKMYGDIFDLIEDAYKDMEKQNVASNYFFEALYLGPEIITAALKCRALEFTLPSGNQEKIDEVVSGLKKDSKNFFKNYHLETDKKLFVSMFKMYKENVEKDYYPTVFDEIDEKYEGDFAKYAEEVYSKSILVDQNKFNEFLNDPKIDILRNDPGYQLMNSVLQVYFKIQTETKAKQDDLKKGMRLYTKAYLEMQKEKNPDILLYPDANSTMRLTYGQVGGYKANDKEFRYYTNMDGYMKKEDPNNPEFIVSSKLKKLYKNKDWGRYGDDGELRVCFITDTDITGGNSGSPVLNDNGELIGIAFDGNWEAMSGDIAFEPELQRTICVDIRFVLFVMDKYAGAQNLIDEMSIVSE